LTPSPGIVGLISKPYCPVGGVVEASGRLDAAVAATVAGSGRLFTRAVAVTVGAGERTSTVNAPSTPRSVPTTLRYRRVSPAARVRSKRRRAEPSPGAPTGLKRSETATGFTASEFVSHRSAEKRPTFFVSMAFGKAAYRRRVRAAAGGTDDGPAAAGATAGPSSVTRSVSGPSGKPTVASETAPTSVPVPARRFARSTTSCTVRLSPGASGRSHCCPSSDTTEIQGDRIVATKDAT